MSDDDYRQAGRAADLDAELIEHAIGCEMAFCRELKKALKYIWECDSSI